MTLERLGGIRDSLLGRAVRKKTLGLTRNKITLRGLMKGKRYRAQAINITPKFSALYHEVFEEQIKLSSPFGTDSDPRFVLNKKNLLSSMWL